MATIALLEEWLIHVKDVPSDQILGTLHKLIIQSGVWRCPVIRLLNLVTFLSFS
jgi:hypothetical protein